MKRKTKILLALSPLMLVLMILLAAVIRFMSFGVPVREFGAAALTARDALDGTWKGRGAVTPPFGTFAAFRQAEVSLKIQGGRIIAIDVLEPLGVDEQLASFKRAVLDRQGSDVDTVAGATWTTGAARKAVADALAKAGSH